MDINTDSVTRPARRMQTTMTCGAAIVAVVAVICVLIAIASPQPVGEQIAHFSGFDAGPLETWQIAVLSAIASVHFLVWIAVLLVGGRVFGYLADGRPELAGDAARTLSLWLWGMLAWGLFSQLILSGTATWNAPPGERAIAISLGTPQISVAFSALFAGFMARAFALGAELWQDHRAVV